MRVLFLSPRQCLPAISGAKLRDYHLARALAQHADLTYVYFVEPGSAAFEPAQLSPEIRVIAIPAPRGYSPWKILRGIVGKWPLPVLNYTSPLMMEALARFDTAKGYDLIHVDSIHMIRYAQNLQRTLGPAAKVVYDWHNIESELMRRYAESASQARRLYANLTANKLETLELEILASARGHIVCSEREREQLQRLSPAARIAVIENGVDSDYFAAPVSGQTRHRIVFVGKMDYHSNVDAVCAFAKNTWPTIRDALRPWLNAVFTIVGSSPAPPVQALSGIPGVEVTGTVPDVRPYYREALAAVVPLRTGGGTRLKILEAMAAAVPVVSTPLGAEGLAVTPGTDVLISDCDDTAAWVQHLVELARSADRVQEITTRALQLVKNRYDWKVIASKLIDTYDSWQRDS